MLKDFRTYQLALELYQACSTLRLRSHLQDQLHRASLSVVLNLAEGSAKPTIKDQRRFFAIAYGSAREVQAILQITHNNKVFQLADKVGAHLYKLTHPTINPKPGTG